MYLIGIDIGGTKISVCIGNEKGKLISIEKIPTQPLRGWKQGVRAIEALILKLLQRQKLDLHQIKAIGISSPGPISKKLGQILRSPNLPYWENAPLVSYFEKALQKTVVFNNDANAAALAEYHFGRAKKSQNLFYLTCSTGMGGGAIIDGKLVQGISDTAAEVGHFVLDIHGPQCLCGQKGCFEAYCGGAALAKKMEKEIVEKKIKTKILDVGEIDAAALVYAVAQQDPYALKVWDEFVLRMAQGIGTVLMNFNPEVLLLGTIAIHAGPLLLKPMQKLLPRFAWKENIEACRIEMSTVGAELSGLALAMEA